jgi:hypothetical protein
LSGSGTITLSTSSSGYATLANIKTLLAITSTNATDDAVIEKLILQASRVIDNICLRRFYTTSTDDTRYFTADNPYCLYVGDLVSVTSIATDPSGLRAYGDSWTTADYDLNPYNAAYEGIPYSYITTTPSSTYSFPPYEKGVKVIGKWGYSTAPADIERACMAIVTNVYHNRYGQNVQGAAVVTGAGVVITPNDVPEEVMLILQQYKRRT